MSRATKAFHHLWVRTPWLAGRPPRQMVSDGLLVLVPPIGFFIAQFFYNNQLLLLTMMLYVVLAQGINIIFGFTGYLPFGYVGFFGAGAYGTALSVIFLHVPAALAVLLGGVAGVLLGALLSPLLRLSGAYFAIASLAAAEALYYLISNPQVSAVTNGPYGVNLSSVYNSGAAYIAAVALVGLAGLCVVWVRRSHFGMSLRAIRADPLSARMAGVQVVRARTYAWLISSTLAGLAGAIYGWAVSVFYPEAVFDLSISVFAIVFALFGGVGTVLGPLLGTIVLFGVYNAIGISQPQYFQLIYGVLIVLIVLFLPNGLLSIRLRGRSRVK
ncbi:MAG TPA: branched-chain amino acid ABC transporter permease [Candidatus Micrarchaeaceae archaeon]|nr:branched-chain amino acid ABC transporter permease [Candidatus Micrarchaeaceae archaeon]